MEDQYIIQQITELREAMSSNMQAHTEYERRLSDLENYRDYERKALLTMQDIKNDTQNLVKQFDKLEKKMDALTTRVDALEREPATNWKKMGFEIVKYVVLALIGAAMGYLIKGA